MIGPTMIRVPGVRVPCCVCPYDGLTMAAADGGGGMRAAAMLARSAAGPPPCRLIHWRAGLGFVCERDALAAMMMMMMMVMPMGQGACKRCQGRVERVCACRVLAAHNCNDILEPLSCLPSTLVVRRVALYLVGIVRVRGCQGFGPAGLIAKQQEHAQAHTRTWLTWSVHATLLLSGRTE